MDRAARDDPDRPCHEDVVDLAVGAPARVGPGPHRPPPARKGEGDGRPPEVHVAGEKARLVARREPPAEPFQQYRRPVHEVGEMGPDDGDGGSADLDLGEKGVAPIRGRPGKGCPSSIDLDTADGEPRQDGDAQAAQTEGGVRTLCAYPAQGLGIAHPKSPGSVVRPVGAPAPGGPGGRIEQEGVGDSSLVDLVASRRRDEARQDPRRRSESMSPAAGERLRRAPGPPPRRRRAGPSRPRRHGG